MMTVIAKRPGPSVRRRVEVYAAGVRRTSEDTLVTEEPLEIRLAGPGQAGTRVAVTMRTPGNDFELTAGFMLSEGLIEPSGHLASITYCLDRTLTDEQMYNVVSVTLERPALRPIAGRLGSVSAACGVCGKQSIDDVLPVTPRATTDRTSVDVVTLMSLPDVLREQQGVFSRTGGLHAAGVFTPGGAPIVVREDVGRHNAVDKVLGARLLGTASYDDASVLCVSGRVGFDIITKTIAGGFPVLVAVGAPSSLAVELSERAGITVCGFVRGQRLVCYSHPERLSGAAEPTR
jgi:FdhD protein